MKCYCSNCRTYVTCVVEEELHMNKILGEEFECVFKVARCELCGGFIQNEDIVRHNLKKLEEAYYGKCDTEVK